MTKILSLLNYMKTYNKGNPTLFNLKELSSHLSLNEDETLKILKEAKKLGYIKVSGGLISNDVAISSQYYITEVGINKTNEYQTTIKSILKWLLITIAGAIIGFYMERFLGGN